jgi:hypothetical protein
VSGFFPHTGGSPSGYTALPASTFDDLLDDIVADVGAGQNGWTLHDDQRTAFTPLVLPCNVNGLNMLNMGMVFTSGASTLTQTTYGRFRRNWIPGVGGTYISPNQTDWYYLSAIASHVAATLDRNYVGTTTTTATGHNIYEKSGPYIVLKHTSSQKTFYVLIARPVSYGIGLRVQVFEAWNAGTHVGTNGGPQEEMRCFEDGNGRSGTTALQYMLFLLPDALGLWLSGSTSEAGANNSDFFYAGNLNPLRVGDNTCLIQACTHQDLSGIKVDANPGYNALTATNRIGAAPMFQNISGQTWNDPRAVASWTGANEYAIVPRGFSYQFGLDRTNLDDGAKFQFCELDAFWTGPVGAGFDKNEGKRGELRHLKVPVMNPSGLHLASLGPADDGNTYILFVTSGPNNASAAPTTYQGDVVYNAAPFSGFAWSWRTGSLGQVVVAANTYTAFLSRWFMLPINL